MTLFLTSSPCIQGVERAVLNPANGFVERIRAALPERPRCLFLCSDPKTPELTDRFGQDMVGAFREAEMPFGSFTVLDGRNEDQAAKLIADSTFIILAGGHVPTQNRFFQKIGLKALLARYDGVIMGISAGTMNAAETVYAQPEREGESIDPEYCRFLPGLGLTMAQILPHYQMIQDWTLDGKRLFQDITYPDSHGRCFYVLPDGSYLYGTQEGQWIVGEANVIRDGTMCKMQEEGELAAI